MGDNMTRYRIANKVDKNGRKLYASKRRCIKFKKCHRAWCTVGTSKTKPYDLPFGTGTNSDGEGADKK